jgi:hypothetical protein
MTQINAQRMTVEVEGDFVVFLIGMRINKPLKVHKWVAHVPGKAAHAEGAQESPESGLLG